MTIKSLLAALAVLSAVSASPVPQIDIGASQIVGGVSAQAGDFPFIVSMQLDGDHICGGSLLDSTTVLTAAHCVEALPSKGVTIRAGSLKRNSGGVVSTVAQLIAHPGYNSTTSDSDVGILKLKTPIAETSTIKYASLAAAGTDPAPDTITTVAGWGTEESGAESSPVALRKVNVPIISRSKCYDEYQKNDPPYPVTDTMICAGLDAGGKDACQGDSGGPLIEASSGTVIGAVSWGIGCAAPKLPGVYARVSSLRDFIDKHL
ncbi:hypothetical protein EKO04_004996 [Ascochyta lentis]|uniref:Peptidase S1 domain-containing protein n=1 Tax=Ascochyta lentis TaxID=205686 RepID=A0A8H7J7W6_9PLEO|nr:hypothetical protein EKO04_004996 [Ascochyta lentis]